jgi:Zn-dependent peptidase ImmA (M78 family)
MANKRNDNPEVHAEETLAKFNFRLAPVPVEKVAKGLGALVRFSPLDDKLSGMIFIRDDVPIIGVNALHHPNRQRFTIAHEIGHLVMHRAILSTEVHVDHTFAVLMRDATSATGQDDKERQANHFAAALLVPRDLLDKELKGKSFDIDGQSPVDELAKKFRVSKQMIEFRISNLPISR